MSNKTSDKNVVNIEDDVNKIKEIIKRCEDFNKNLGYESEIYDGDTPFPYKELEHILEERVQDKKRIQELEVLEDDLKDKRIVYVDTPEFEEKFIPKQKVKDKFNKLITRIKEFKDPEIKKYFSIEQIIELLEQFKNKFLEDK